MRGVRSMGTYAVTYLYIQEFNIKNVISPINYVLNLFYLYDGILIFFQMGMPFLNMSM